MDDVEELPFDPEGPEIDEAYRLFVSAMGR
jgi:hypothetical protein